MFFAAKAFRINLVNILGAGRARGEPAILRGDLDATDGVAVSGRVGQDRQNFLAGQIWHLNALLGDLRKLVPLLAGCGRIGTIVKWIAEFFREFLINFARIFLRGGRDLRRQQGGDDAVFILSLIHISTILEKSAFGFPAVRQRCAAILRPPPIRAAIERVGQFADFMFVGSIAGKIHSRG